MLSSASISKLLDGKALLIFDFDGTIADTSTLHAEAFRQALKPLGVEPNYESIAGLRTRDAILKCMQDKATDLTPAEVERLVQTKQAIVRDLIATRLMPLPGVSYFLSMARTRLRLALATSGSRGTVSQALQKLGYESMFSTVLCAEDVVHAKPSPEIFLSALSQSGHRPEEALIFEDSEAGLLAAKNACIDSLDIRSSGWEPFASYAGAYWK